jgi:hypothetical protein
MKKIYIALASFFALTLTLPLWAESEITSSTELSLAISSLPEAKLGLKQSFVFPFLQGDNPLTADNNITTSFTAEISPISLNVIANATWTPIAFFQLSANTMIGTGWNINLFGNDIYGIGIHSRGNDRESEINGRGFDGAFWRLGGGATFQFDLAAIFPGECNHVLFRTYHEIYYRGFSRASSGDSWVFENELRENRNGFNYYGTFFVGYQMPLMLNVVGLMADVDVFLYDAPSNRKDWGDERGRWIFSILGNFAFTERLNTALIIQCRTMRNFDNEDIFYQDRLINRSNPIRLEFYRVAAIINFKLR